MEMYLSTLSQSWRLASASGMVGGISCVISCLRYLMALPMLVDSGLHCARKLLFVVVVVVKNVVVVVKKKGKKK